MSQKKSRELRITHQINDGRRITNGRTIRYSGCVCYVTHEPPWLFGSKVWPKSFPFWLLLVAALSLLKTRYVNMGNFSYGDHVIGRLSNDCCSFVLVVNYDLTDTFGTLVEFLSKYIPWTNNTHTKTWHKVFFFLRRSVEIGKVKHNVVVSINPYLLPSPPPFLPSSLFYSTIPKRKTVYE